MNVINHPSAFNSSSENAAIGYLLLQKKLLRICIFNLFLLSLVGLLLRAWPIFSFPFLSYKNVLHAHSHFAFGGWVMPVLTCLILKFFPDTCTLSAYRHWRNSIVLMFAAAYGMLLSFPFQGYGAVSILFSTLSMASGFYLANIIRSAPRPQFFLASWSFLSAGFFYFFLSAIGPLATGPLHVIGKAGTPIYHNAIYFYLHFQYNGFFSFLVLAVLYKMIERIKPFNHGKLVFRLLNIACIPAYFLSVLWTQPSILFYIAGGVAAALQLIAAILLVNDSKGIGWKHDKAVWLFRIAIFAFIAKVVLQLLSAFPLIAELAYQNRNFIIAYLHLVLIGFVSVFVFAAILNSASQSYSPLMYKGILLFLFGFTGTELLLILQPAGGLNFLTSLHYSCLLFGVSIFFPVGLLLIYFAQQKQHMNLVLNKIGKPPGTSDF